MAGRRKTKGARRGRRGLSHVEGFPGAGFRSRMVDVGAKPVTARSAIARARLRFPARTLAKVLESGGPKGPVTEIARAAGILAAKRTAELIPMCHPLGLDHVEILFEPLLERGRGSALEIRCRAAHRGRTGIEMEALVGAAIAALTVYDMVKALDPGITIETVELLEKRGGRSGTWKRGRDAR
jgi:cyclic pyranopterin phosphate synthase